MMIGTEEIDQLIIATVKLVDMVRDIRRQIRIAAVALDEHAVLIVAEIGCAQPQSAFAFIRHALSFQRVQRLVHHTAVINALFTGPDVKLNAEGRQIGFQLRQLGLQSVLRKKE